MLTRGISGRVLVAKSNKQRAVRLTLNAQTIKTKIHADAIASIDTSIWSICGNERLSTDSITILPWMPLQRHYSVGINRFIPFSGIDCPPRSKRHLHSKQRLCKTVRNYNRITWFTLMKRCINTDGNSLTSYKQVCPNTKIITLHIHSAGTISIFEIAWLGMWVKGATLFFRWNLSVNLETICTTRSQILISAN